MWIAHSERIVCDICGEDAGPLVCVGNIIIAEVCPVHAETFKAAIRGILKTQPGPIDIREAEAPYATG